MNKKNLKLQDLKVKSFITDFNIKNIKAGGTTNFDTLQEIGSDCGCSIESILATCECNGSLTICIYESVGNTTCTTEQSIENAFCNKKTRQANCHNITVIC